MAPPEIIALRDQLKDWLLQAALPLWSTVGVDANGGFLEKIDMAGVAVESPRRARVTARQVYVFDQAARLGWTGPSARRAEQALHRLLDPHGFMRTDGLVRILIAADGAVLDDTPALYEQAFALLAMAMAGREDAALKLLAALQDRQGKAGGGFYESDEHHPPLDANPHMHLLEAALAWVEAGGGSAWRDLAASLGEIALTHLIDPASGAIAEFRDDDWTPAAGSPLDCGHQFEWGWLLLKFARLLGRADAVAPALRLIGIGETRGVDPARNVAFNLMQPDLTPLDLEARLWPQTERLHAHAAAAAMTGDAAHWQGAAAGARGLMAYLDTPVLGLWRDRRLADGAFVEEPAPASSLYHIVSAILALDEAVGGAVG
jgi:mannose/cellobiose epimerase-like protein (N-acyl-D-glucosamine 2-epimerase family)